MWICWIIWRKGWSYRRFLGDLWGIKEFLCGLARKISEWMDLEISGCSSKEMNCFFFTFFTWNKRVSREERFRFFKWFLRKIFCYSEIWQNLKDFAPIFFNGWISRQFSSLINFFFSSVFYPSGEKFFANIQSLRWKKFGYKLIEKNLKENSFKTFNEFFKFFCLKDFPVMWNNKKRGSFPPKLYRKRIFIDIFFR